MVPGFPGGTFISKLLAVYLFRTFLYRPKKEVAYAILALFHACDACLVLVYRNTWRAFTPLGSKNDKTANTDKHER